MAFSEGNRHYWRFDYTHEGKRKTLSYGAYTKTNLALAREIADQARARVTGGKDPSEGRKQFKQGIAIGWMQKNALSASSCAA